MRASSLQRLFLIASFCLSCGHASRVCAQADDAGVMTQSQVWQQDTMPLSQALEMFSIRTGLRLVFRPEQVANLQAPALTGELSYQQALEQLLSGSGLIWSSAGNRMLAVRQPLPPTSVSRTPAVTAPSAASTRLPDSATIPVLISTATAADASLRRVRTGPVPDQSLFEMPRSASVLSRNRLDVADVTGVDDLVRAVPAVYTLARFGVQGAADIRNASADVYFRGMKRVNLEGHVPGVLGLIDRIDIMRGPPSPLTGIGKPGGYTDIYPLMDLGQASASVELRAGRFDRGALTFGAQNTLDFAGHPARLLLGVLAENTGDMVKGAAARNRVIQSGLTIEPEGSGYRLESGVYLQQSKTSGALVNRATQSLVDDGIYIQGSPLVNLDINGNGRIGFLEMHTASPVEGALAAGNQPLIQYWSWPRDQDMKPLPLSQFPAISTIPHSLYSVLEARPTLDPHHVLRDRGIGGVLPESGWIPAGFALSPEGVGLTAFDRRRGGAFERDIGADSLIAYFDVVPSGENLHGWQNQFFVDVLDQYKLSEQPGGGKQDVRVIENRLGRYWMRKRSDNWQMDVHLSSNVRDTRASGYRFGGDQGNHRIDVSVLPVQGDSNSRFVHAFDNPDLFADGAPWVTRYLTRYREHGAGLMMDIRHEALGDLMLGLRYDHVDAVNINFAGTLDPNQGSSAAPGRIRTRDQRETGSDQGGSWHISYSKSLANDWRFYITRSRSSMVLDDINNRLENRVIAGGMLGDSDLREYGVRWLSTDLQHSMALTGFNQKFINRDDYGFTHRPSYLTSFSTTGWELEYSFSFSDILALNGYITRQVTHLTDRSEALVLVDARTLGFQDVLDSHGTLVYPAEAFLYGGRSFLRLPSDVTGYNKRQGYPPYQSGLSLSWRVLPAWTLHAGVNHFSSTYSGRLKQIRLPEQQIASVGIDHLAGEWKFSLDINNMFDSTWLRARSRDVLGETLLTTMPGRTWQLVVSYSFPRR